MEGRASRTTVKSLPAAWEHVVSALIQHTDSRIDNTLKGRLQAAEGDGDMREVTCT